MNNDMDKRDLEEEIVTKDLEQGLKEFQKKMEELEDKLVLKDDDLPEPEEAFLEEELSSPDDAADFAPEGFEEYSEPPAEEAPETAATEPEEPDVTEPAPEEAEPPVPEPDETIVYSPSKEETKVFTPVMSAAVSENAFSEEPAASPEPQPYVRPRREPLWEEPVQEPEPPAKNKKDKKKEKKEKPPKKKKGIFSKFLIFLIVLAMIGGAGYAAYHYVLDPDEFLKGSTINGVDVSGLTARKAELKLVDEWNSNTLTITEKGSVIGTLEGFELDYDVKDQIDECLHPEFVKILTRFIYPSEREYTVEMKLKDANLEAFGKRVEELDFVKNHEVTTKTENAYVDISTTEFEVIPEVQGDDLDVEKLKAALLESVAAGNFKFDYLASRYYKEPEITTESQEIKDRLEFAHTYLSTEITWLLPDDDSYTLSPKQLNSMISVDDKGTISVKKKKTKAFLSDTLAPLCNTIGMTRKLKLAGGNITISGGDYGYTLDVDKEYKQLKKDLESGKNMKRHPEYDRKGYGMGDGNDIGDTYIEVSISQQTVWYVQNGKTKLTSSVVTGDPTIGFGTPKGVYGIMYTESPSTLKGENADGSQYETKVTYWMPFYAGCGFHDAPWRGSFGGSIYKGNGSHGCVNMPPSAAKELYGYVEAGMPVIVH